MAAVYGDAGWLDETAQVELLYAYVRRQKWLARLQAVAVVNALGEAMGGGEKKPMSLGALAMMGFRVEGADG